MQCLCMAYNMYNTLCPTVYTYMCVCRFIPLDEGFLHFLQVYILLYYTNNLFMTRVM